MRLSLLTILVACSSAGLAQYDVDGVENDTLTKDSKFDLYKMREHTYVGGDISLRFGTVTYLYVAPLIGYDVYKNLSVGVSGVYQLLRWNNGSYISNESTVGFGTFIRYRPIPPIILQTEFDLYNTVNYTGTPEPRINIPAYFAGLGYAGNMGNRAYYNVLLMYDFINHDYMPLIPFITKPFYLRAGMVWYLG